jgi:crossover junction endodeoxyribonuclease RuvC
MIWLGVDPGKSGAFALVSNEGLLHVFDMPLTQVRYGNKTEHEICPHQLRDELLSLQHEHGKIRVAVVEKVSSSPQMGVKSAFSFGEGFGGVKFMLAALCIPVEFVRPQTWKKYMGLDADKKASLALARAKWPAADHFTRAKDDGRAEASLLAEYGRRNGL